jgi:nucleotide-binding universal stress UspA family protein
MQERAMLPLRTVLHPTDFSEQSGFAFRLACSLARDYDACVIVLHVAATPVVAAPDGMIPMEPEGYQDELRQSLELLRPRDSRIRVEHRLIEGDAASQILRVAAETRSDVIVMGTHGRTGLGRLLMGSVAEEVVRRAACPVVTVKTPLPETPSAAEPIPETTARQAGGNEGGGPASRALPRGVPQSETGLPGGGRGRVDVTGIVPEDIHVDPDLTEGHPGYAESGGSEIIPPKP